MFRVPILALEGALRTLGRRRFAEPRERWLSHFGPGGLEEAEAACEAANSDLLAFVRAPRAVPARRVAIAPAPETRFGGRVVALRFESPYPTGPPRNDVVHARLMLPPARTGEHHRVVVFHHPMRHDDWRVWEWFLAPLAQHVPVALMAGPHHFERCMPGEFGGQRVCNANPWRLYEAVRQWTWDQAALRTALIEHFGLLPTAVLGFSLGAYQTLLAAAAGCLDGLPLAVVGTTSRYAWGLQHGWAGRDIYAALRGVGIDDARLARMTRAIDLEHYVDRLKTRDVLFVEGIYDRVDPPPSVDRLVKRLQPSRHVQLEAGHGTLLLWRSRILGEVRDFLASCEAIDIAPPIAEARSQRRQRLA